MNKKEIYTILKRDYDRKFKGLYAPVLDRKVFFNDPVTVTHKGSSTIIKYSTRRFMRTSEDYQDYLINVKIRKKEYEVFVDHNYILNLYRILDDLKIIGHFDTASLTKIRKQANIILNNFKPTKKKDLVFDSPVSYLIKDELTGFYKIGISCHPLKREKTLQAERPVIKLVKVFENNIESELHYKYRRQRLRGEWFELNKVQVRYICTHY